MIEFYSMRSRELFKSLSSSMNSYIVLLNSSLDSSLTVLTTYRIQLPKYRHLTPFWALWSICFAFHVAPEGGVSLGHTMLYMPALYRHLGKTQSISGNTAYLCLGNQIPQISIVLQFRQGSWEHLCYIAVYKCLKVKSNLTLNNINCP